MSSFIDWDAINQASANPTYEGIRQTMTTPRGSYRDIAGAEIMPLLQQGVDPALQKAIDEIVRQGQLSKQRTLSDVTTASQSRGLTGSSIESGDITQAATQAELGQQGQITGILAQDATAKRNQMVDFLTKAYGMDFEQANKMADNMAQLMGQELGRQTDYDIAMKTIEANKKAGEFKWTDLLAPAIQAGGVIASDRRLKKNIQRLGEIKGIGIYAFDYDHSKKPGLPQGQCLGVMSEDVKHFPKVVIVGDDGYDMVNYTELAKVLN